MNTMTRHLPRTLLTLLVWLNMAALMAQVQVTPTLVVLDTKQRTREITIKNPTTEPVEVDVSLRYALLRSDAIGHVRKDTSVTEDERKWSAAEWLRVFPRKVAVPANGSRVVRLIASPPPGTPDGEYWSDMLFHVDRVERPRDFAADTTDTTAAVVMDLDIGITISIPVNYRVGQVTTGIEFDSVICHRDTNGFWLLLDGLQTGNAAYRGTFHVQLTRSDGTQLPRISREYTILFYRRVPMLLGDIPPGNYTMEIETESVRRGSATEAVIRVPSRKFQYNLTVGPSGRTSDARRLE